jgi:hypothetical protein
MPLRVAERAADAKHDAVHDDDRPPGLASSGQCGAQPCKMANVRVHGQHGRELIPQRPDSFPARVGDGLGRVALAQLVGDREQVVKPLAPVSAQA